MATATPPKPRTDSAPNAGASPGWKPELREIPLEAIDVGANVRSAEALDVQELAASIRARGVISPIRVEEAGTRDGAARFALVYGQRRLAAAKVAGLKTIPALVDAANRTARNLIVEQLLENLQREDLNAVDTARAYKQLLGEGGLTQRQLAEELGIAQPTIANTLAVLKQPAAIQERVVSGELTRSHVEVLAKLPEAEREEVARRVVEHKLSTRDLEQELNLAVERQKAADRDRDVAKAIVPKAIEKLEAAGHDKAKVTLVVEEPNLRAGLKAAGWAVTTGGTQLYYNETDECPAVSVRWVPSWGAKYGPDLSAVCIVPEHKKARDEAKKQREVEYRAQMERDREQRTKEEAKKRAAVEAQQAAVVNAIRGAGAVGDVDLLRLIVVALVGEDDPDELIERHVDEDKREAFEDVDDQVWVIVSQLEAPQLIEEIGRALVATLANGYWTLSDGAKAKLLELAGETKPKAAKKAKAKG